MVRSTHAASNASILNDNTLRPTHFDAKTEQPDAEESGQTSEPDTENAPEHASDTEEDEYLVNPNRR